MLEPVDKLYELTMPYGYHGRILHVDLTQGLLEIEQPDEAFYRMYVDGSALGMFYLLRQAPKGVDPIGTDNVLVLALSVLTGAPISGQSRMTAVAKSPLTGAADHGLGHRYRRVPKDRRAPA
jgi:aldehyde:ferredoxin oxidoreductase